MPLVCEVGILHTESHYFPGSSTLIQENATLNKVWHISKIQINEKNVIFFTVVEKDACIGMYVMYLRKIS